MLLPGPLAPFKTQAAASFFVQTDIHKEKRYIMNTFIQSYIESSKRIYRNTTGREMPLEREKLLEDMIMAKATSPEVENIVVHNNKNHEVYEQTFLELMDDLYSDKYILSAYGTMFLKHAVKESDLISFLVAMQDNRKAEKKMALDHINDTDLHDYFFHQIRQLLYKLVGNAEYGASGEENYIFGNPYIGPSTTYNGYAVITSGIMFLESMMENNINFSSTSDVLRFIEECEMHAEKYPDQISDWLDNPNEITAEVLAEYLSVFKKNEGGDIERSIVLEYAKRMTAEERNRIYYTNNLYKFIDQEKVLGILAGCYSLSFTNPDKPPEDIADSIKLFVSVVRKFVSHPYVKYNRPAIVKSLKRKNVLLVDSDSLFTYLGRFIEHFETLFEVDVAAKNHKIAVSHIAVHLIGKLIQDILDAVTKGFNVSEKYQPRINMKSEFLFSRVSMTKNKKNYSSVKLVVEGHVLEKPDDEIKGLAIKKVSTNARTRDYFMKMLKDKVLHSQEIDPKSILLDFLQYESIVYDSLTNTQSTEFLTPGNFKNLSVYKKPEANSVVKAVKLWNAMRPNDAIQPYSKVHLLKLKQIMSAEDLYIIKEEYPNEYAALVQCISDKEYFGKSGAKAIAVPKSIKIIPDVLVKLIDTNTIVIDNTKAAYPIMESVGFQMIQAQKNLKQFTTFIDL